MSVSLIATNIYPPGCTIFKKQQRLLPNAISTTLVYSLGVTKDLTIGMILPLIGTTNGKMANKSILFYGPHGTGKSLATKFGCQATADFSRATEVFHIDIHGSQLLDGNKKQGFSRIQTAFNLLRLRKPAVCFLDRADEFLKKGSDGHDLGRMALKQHLIYEMDKRDENEQTCFVAAVTNIHDVDEEILRRFDVKTYFALPDSFGREKLLQSECRFVKNVNVREIDFKKLTAATKGFSGFDITTLIKTVYNKKVLQALNIKNCEYLEDMTLIIKLTMEDFDDALLCLTPGNTPEDMKQSIEYLKKRPDFKDFFSFLFC